jgi:glycosyltransferase involved in cell wall biosynthesis
MNDTKPITSVLLPVYNGETYLRTAIESILKQTFTDFEFIIINDGSSDKSEEIILSFKDKRIRYIRNEKNLGIIQTLNKGLALSNGKYIVRMDADDISMPKRIEKQVAFMDEHRDIGVAGSQYYSFSDTKLTKVYTYTESEVLRSLLMFKSCLCHPAVIIRKSVLAENNIKYDERYKHAEDYDFWVQISKISKLSNVKEFLLKYRSHDKQGSIIHNTTQKDSAEIIRENYLKDLGFNFTENDLQINNIIANNRLITSEKMLADVENWLLKLAKQNGEKKSIEHKHFNFLLGKTWYDSCGITNLGLFAYNRYFKSPLSACYPLSSKQKVMLATKCTVRRFKK